MSAARSRSECLLTLGVRVRPCMMIPDFVKSSGNATLTGQHVGTRQQSFCRWCHRNDPHLLTTVEDHSHRPYRLRQSPPWDPPQSPASLHLISHRRSAGGGRQRIRCRIRNGASATMLAALRAPPLLCESFMRKYFYRYSILRGLSLSRLTFRRSKPQALSEERRFS